MSEQLYIRLGSTDNSPIHWLVWSNNENEIIASGELSNAAQLNTLHDRAGGRRLSVLVPGTDVITRQVEMPPKANRQFIQALPYSLEEDLAEDVDELFFAPADKVTVDGKTMLNVAICRREKMDAWLAWLSDAELVAQRIIPDYLALPITEHGLSALQLGDEWLIRQGQFSGFNVEQSALPQWLSFIPPETFTASNTFNVNESDEADESELNDADDSHVEKNTAESESSESVKVVLAHYSPLPDTALPAGYQASAQTYELPLQVLAHGLNNSALNLRQGIYQLKKDTWKFVAVWRNVAVFAFVLLLVHLAGQGIRINQLEAQVTDVEKQVRSEFIAAFPTAKKIRTNAIRKYMKSKLKGVSAGGTNASFFAIVDKGREAFKQVPDLKPTGFRFDGKRGEVRIQAKGNNFASFERFKTVATAQGLAVDQGSLNDSSGQVNGTITIKVAP